MTRDDPHFRLRLPPDLKRRISISAKINSRSINSEIVHALEAAYPGTTLSDLADMLAIMVSDQVTFEDESLREDLQRVVDAFRRAVDNSPQRPLAPDHDS